MPLAGRPHFDARPAWCARERGDRLIRICTDVEINVDVKPVRLSLAGNNVRWPSEVTSSAPQISMLEGVF
jgi:hypothetical protein